MSMMNPLAGPSGPGPYSTRTDKLSLGSTSYGDDSAELNTAAPKSKTRGVADDVGGRPTSVIPEAPVTPLFAPSERPDEPITNGIDIGPGAGSSALMMAKSNEKLSDTLAKMIPYDTSGEVAILYQQALARGQ
jgi:hypothetical protein